ncbi:Ribosomal large subunit pseudouridine synthase E [Labeo rohita]|uniref:Ribosomal large subunit pseudouridine synthase E n=1 Tax=Labeo rohita TaxID=84645 RepID=A0ABQ8MSU9_LABRO|nr:Ribosomal large subunit pseudouridine synthase E [Labeo rohita]
MQSHSPHHTKPVYVMPATQGPHCKMAAIPQTVHKMAAILKPAHVMSAFPSLLLQTLLTSCLLLQGLLTSHLPRQSPRPRWPPRLSLATSQLLPKFPQGIFLGEGCSIPATSEPPTILEVLPPSAALPVMAIAILSVWAAHRTSEASSVHELVCVMCAIIVWYKYTLMLPLFLVTS